MIRALLHTAIFFSFSNLDLFFAQLLRWYESFYTQPSSCTDFIKSWSLCCLVGQFIPKLSSITSTTNLSSVWPLLNNVLLPISFFQPPFHWFVEPLTMLLIIWSCHGPIFLKMAGKLNDDSMNFDCHFWAQTLSLSHLKVHFLGNFSQAQTLFHTGFSPMCCRLEKVSDVRTQGPVDDGGR